VTECEGRHILLAGTVAGIFVLINLANAGSQHAYAFEVESDSKAKEGLSRETISFNGQIRNFGWLSVKFDGSVLDLNPARTDAPTSYGFKLSEPVQMEKTAVTDTRVTLGVWDDWIRFSSRQGASNYMTPGTDILKQTGSGFDNFATSQRLETTIWKTDATRVALFSEYARVGPYFASPDLAKKRQDPFSQPNSTTARLGATIEQGPLTFTLEQRAHQSLVQDNAPIQVQNQIGMAISFDELRGRYARALHGMSWIVPSSAWLNVGQGKVRASLDQGVAGDTTSDVSFGLSWALGKFTANLGYWRSDYQSQLYPWKGSGANGSIGFHEDLWAIDIYFDVASSAASYAITAVQQPTTQTLDVTSGLLFRTRF
jgi:hypothetical protein